MTGMQRLDVRRPPNWIISGLLGVLLGLGIATTLGDDRPATSVATNSTQTTTTTTMKRPSTTRATTTTSAPELGTRANPYAPGGQVVLSREGQEHWQIEVAAFEPDAGGVVLAENSGNLPPAEGRQFAMATLEVTYLGPEEPVTLFSQLEFAAVDDSNVAYDFENSCGIIPGKIDDYGDIYTGGTISGNVCWEVRSDSVDSLLLTIGDPYASGPMVFLDLA
jgi:hypothetical protein